MNISYYKCVMGVIILISLLLIGYWQFNNRSPIIPTHNWVETPINVTTHFYDSVRSLSQAYWTNVKDDGKERYGWAVWYPEDKECVIHVVEVKHANDNRVIETLGHEFLHCLYGSWHKE